MTEEQDPWPGHEEVVTTATFVMGRPVGSSKGRLIPSDSPIAAIAARYAHKREERELADSRAAYLKGEETQLADQLFSMLEAQGLRSVRTPDGTFTLDDKAWATITDPLAVRRWAEDNMPEAITVNHTKLSVILRREIERIRDEGGDPLGAPLIPGVEPRFSRGILLRRT